MLILEFLYGKLIFIADKNLTEFSSRLKFNSSIFLVIENSIDRFELQLRIIPKTAFEC